MNSIQEAMIKKAHQVCGPIEHEIDKFIDNKFKSTFNMVKYLEKLNMRPKMVKIIQTQYQPLLEELKSTEEDFIEAYSYMTQAQKNKFIAFITKIINSCDEYLVKHESTFKAEREMKRLKRQMKKKHDARIQEIEKSTGYKRRK